MYVCRRRCQQFAIAAGAVARVDGGAGAGSRRVCVSAISLRSTVSYIGPERSSVPKFVLRFHDFVAFPCSVAAYTRPAVPHPVRLSRAEWDGNVVDVGGCLL